MAHESFPNYLILNCMLFYLIFLFMLTINSGNFAYAKKLCSGVKHSFQQKGFVTVEIRDEPIPGEDLIICKSEVTCCTKEMEYNLTIYSCAEIHSLLRNDVKNLENIFSSKTKKFDDFFIDLMKTSKKDFHEVFRRKYGILYDMNSFILMEMFDGLQEYYTTGGIDLSDVLDTFFHKLYKIMFQLLNRQHSFNDIYLNCISQHMDEMKPFGDLPKKLKHDVRLSLIATRTFVQGLAVGRDVIRNMLEVPVTPDCCQAVMKMNYCSVCQGFLDISPCSDNCVSVLERCLLHHAEVHSEWNNYIDAMVMLATRLESSFDTESVLDPVDVITDAITTFQGNDYVISQKLFKQCGSPQKKKRDVMDEVNPRSKKFGLETLPISQVANTGITHLVQKIKAAVKKTKEFWIRLPQLMCNNSQTKSDGDDGCWNGNSKLRYKPEDGVIMHRIPPEISETRVQQNSLCNQQILTLKLITDKLAHAYNGLDVTWQDSDSGWTSSGSGSGHGEDLTEDVYFNYGLPMPEYTSKTVVMSGTSCVLVTLLLVVSWFL